MKFTRAIFIGLILFCLFFPIVSAMTFDFNGTSNGYKGTNLIYVNVTESEIPGLVGETEVLIPQPVAGYILEFLADQQLGFDYLGHDISGKLISDAYFEGIRLQELNPSDYF
jgi:hypothetical protein